MPKKPVRSKRRRAKGLAEGYKAVLLHGHDFFGELPEGDDFETNEERQRELWNKERDALIKEYVSTHGAGSRPVAWWKYEAEIRWMPHDRREGFLLENGHLEQWEVASILERVESERRRQKEAQEAKQG